VEGDNFGKAEFKLTEVEGDTKSRELGDRREEKKKKKKKKKKKRKNEPMVVNIRRLEEDRRVPRYKKFWSRKREKRKSAGKDH